MTTEIPNPGFSEANPLRLVLFGLSGSGKSSLIAALGRAATSQEQLLGGKVLLGEELGELLKQPTPEHLKTEVTSYPIRYLPVADSSKLAPAVDAVLVDSDGKAARDLLFQGEEDEFAEEGPSGTLRNEIVDADGLILVLDATAPKEQVEGQFVEFGRFLDAVQRGRGVRAEVGGLPVFLVINKCDRLAQEGDNLASWMERIEQRKRELAERFAKFLADREPEVHSSTAEGAEVESPDIWSPTFGQIELHVWATAVRRPDFVGGREWNPEPYGVAELFRQALAEGTEYRQCCQRSARRLTVVSALSFALVTLFLGFIVGLLVLHRSSQLTLLESRIRDFQYLYRQGSKPGLSGTPEQLKLKKTRLEEIRNNPTFSRLELNDRKEVAAIYDELSEYIALLDDLLSRRPTTSEMVEASLEASVRRLETEQGKLRESWKDTQAATLIRQRIASGKALLQAVRKARNWYLDAAEQAERLLRFSSYAVAADGSGIDWADWSNQVEKLLNAENRPPFRPNDPIPDMGGASLNYQAALRFDTAETARRRWLEDRDAVRRLFSVCAAIGLVTPREYKAPSVLVFSDQIKLPELKQRRAEMLVVYPDYEKRFLRDAIPDRARGAIGRAARAQYQKLVKLGQAEVLAQLRLAGKGTEETLARWEAIREWLKSPEELASWRILARTLLRLESNGALDPVTELAEFLGTRQFTIEVDSVTLTVGALNDLRPRADGRLVIMHGAGAKEPALVFESSGTPVRDDLRRVVLYTFRRSGTRRITYRPGETLWAELQLSGGKEKLVWTAGHAKVFQIDRLMLPPRRQSVTETSPTAGRVQGDLRLGFHPDTGYPTIPDLLPPVQLDD